MPRKKQRRAWGSVTEIKRGKKYVLRWMERITKKYAQHQHPSELGKQ